MSSVRARVVVGLARRGRDGLGPRAAGMGQDDFGTSWIPRCATRAVLRIDNRRALSQFHWSGAARVLVDALLLVPSENVLEPTLVARVRLRGCTGARHRLRPRVSALSSESSQRPFVEQLAVSSLGGALADNAQFMSATRTSRALKAARWPSALAGTAVSAGNCATDGQAACAPTLIRQLKTRSHCRASSTLAGRRQGRGRAHAHTDTPAQTGHSQGGRGEPRAAQRKGPSRERRQSYESHQPGVQRVGLRRSPVDVARRGWSPQADSSARRARMGRAPSRRPLSGPESCLS